MEHVRFNSHILRQRRGRAPKSAIARDVGVSHQVYSNWERGQVPRGDHLFLLIKRLDIPLEALFIVESAADRSAAPSPEVAIAA